VHARVSNKSIVGKKPRNLRRPTNERFRFYSREA
jgi:hypothetical protein